MPWLLERSTSLQQDLVCRGNKDAIQHALNLAMQHLDLFSDRGGQAPPDSKAAQAVAALDALLQDLAVPEEVQHRCHAQCCVAGGKEKWGGVLKGEGSRENEGM